MRKRQILVIGYNEDSCRDAHRRVAYEVGKLVAESGSVLVTGGLGGVMEAASRGASEADGTVVGIIPQNNFEAANIYSDIVIPSGMGLTRDFLNAQSSDGVIIVGGGAGTTSEICAAYMNKRPMVAIRGTGGAADRYADSYMDERKKVIITGVDGPGEAVKSILDQIESSRGSGA